MAPQNITSRIATAAWKKRNPQFELSDADPHIELTLRSVPRYTFDQMEVAVRRRREKTPAPWITADAIALLNQLIRPTDKGIEFGAGGSTTWLARRLGSLISVEQNRRWYDIVRARLAEQNVSNVDLQLIAVDQLGWETPEHRAAYVNARADLTPRSLDFVFVDGAYRDEASVRGIDLLKPGGLFVLDNANSYIPANTRTPWRVDEPASPLWATFLDRVRDWRQIWTTDGTADTALWFKPPG